MAEFSFLSNVPTILLEQIIAKLDWKSYFRLQRTCRQLEEFVRTNQKLYTYLDKNANFKWMGLTQVLLQFTSGFVNINHVYGLRVRLLAPPRHMERWTFPELCEGLKKHRIICSRLSLEPRTGGLDLTREQCADFIKILKPDVIIMESTDSDRYQALVHSKNLKSLLLVNSNPSQIVSVMENLIRYREAKLLGRSACPEEIVEVLVSACQILHTLTPFNANLRNFKLDLSWDAELREGLIGKLRKSMPHLIKKVQAEMCGTRYYIDMPNTAKCTILIESVSSTIIYEQN